MERMNTLYILHATVESTVFVSTGLLYHQFLTKEWFSVACVQCFLLHISFHSLLIFFHNETDTKRQTQKYTYSHNPSWGWSLVCAAKNTGGSTVNFNFNITLNYNKMYSNDTVSLRKALVQFWFHGNFEKLNYANKSILCFVGTKQQRLNVVSILIEPEYYVIRTEASKIR